MQEFPNEDGGYSLENRQLNYPQGPRKLDRSQKIATAVLAFFAILVMGLWITQTKNSLFGERNNEAGMTDSADCPGGDCSDADKAALLKKKDTDKDGLSDYDELYIYNTSPYLEDSDSDGYSDYQEVKSSNDPTCPFGQECFAEELPTEEAVIEGQEDLVFPETGGSGGETKSINQTGTGNVINSGQGIESGASEPAVIRQSLLQAGMDPEALSQFSDTELMSIYREMTTNQ